RPADGRPPGWATGLDGGWIELRLPGGRHGKSGLEIVPRNRLLERFHQNVSGNGRRVYAQSQRRIVSFDANQHAAYRHRKKPGTHQDTRPAHSAYSRGGADRGKMGSGEFGPGSGARSDV